MLLRHPALFLALASITLVGFISAPCSFGGEGEPMAIRQVNASSFSIERHSDEPLTLSDEQIAVAGDPPDAATTPRPLFVGDVPPATEVIVDGVSIWYLGPQNLGDSIVEGLPDGPQPDVLIAAGMDNSDVHHQAIERLLKNVTPATVILTGPIAQNVDAIAESVTSPKRAVAVRRVDHNRLAVCQAEPVSPRDLTLVVMSSEEYVMEPQLAHLFQAMSDSCQASSRVFADLSVEQMSFRPSNGTHTPRWNTEHMSGRQLLFFSEIYHAIDPVIPIMNRNPKQMPPDYEPAHPDWDGAREALEMNRVNDFCRRFAYLLDGVDLNSRAPGSRWTLDGLLKQMDRHFTEHTANTVKKFDLPDWPGSAE